MRGGDDDARERCCFCSERVEGKYRETRGWERRRASGGGQHAGLVAKTYTGRQACNECGDKLARGIPLGQGTLFRA